MQVWAHVGSFGPIWTHFYRKLQDFRGVDPFWTQNGPRMGAWWTHNGLIFAIFMGPFWVQGKMSRGPEMGAKNGPTMGPFWVQNGSMGSFGPIMDP